MTPALLLAFEDESALAAALARALDVPLAFIEQHRFPDGELRLRLPPQLPGEVLLLRGLYPPNDSLVELLIAAPAARQLGARTLALACPYLAYMRQDIAFAPGEAVSQRHVAALIGAAVDALVTVDPHLHRIASLDEVMPGRRTRAVSAAALLGQCAARHADDPLLLGPDEEALQWVAEAARQHALDHAVCRKRRLGDREVRIELPPVDLAGRTVVLMDDVASTGRTLVEAAAACFGAGAATVDVAVTHALFVDDAIGALHAAGVRHVWCSDTVPHPRAVVSVAPLIAGAVRSL